jgi:hypothetical protein
MIKWILIGLAIFLYSAIAWGWAADDYYAWRLSKIIRQQAATDQEMVDLTRDMIYQGTIHLLAGNDDPQTTSDHAVILRGILRDDIPPPVTTCGPRAEVMATILKHLGFETRLVHLFSDDYSSIQSHTFLEVKINGRWQAHDPDFNIYYVDRTGQRAGALAAFEDNAHPVDGWTRHAAYDGSVPLKSYFEVLMYDKRPDISLMIVNPINFNMSKVFPGNEMTFPEFAEIYGELQWLILTN